MLAPDMPAPDKPDAPSQRREEALWARATAALHRLYGDRGEPAFRALMAEIEDHVLRARAGRSPALQALDRARIDQPAWFNQPGRSAYCTYIDRFSGTLSGCIDHIPYLKAAGISLFHPLPLLKPREGDSDGGFAVADYRAVDPRLGTFGDLTALADALRAEGMSLVLDVVCNHTAREHGWARAMVAGDPAFRDFYIVKKDEAEVARWAPWLSDVFPDTAPGSFTWDAEAGGFVWTTFYAFQWDLNYANPRVFLAMLDVLLELANAGVEGFRLDSAAYLWKIEGTICRNLPQAHDILQAFRGLLSIAAPGVFMLAEAIEGLDEVLSYFGDTPEHSECDLAYNNTTMTALWGALAEGRSDVLRQALDLTAQKPRHGVWLNYVRCHDDIIWQALAGWIDQDRLQAWSDFYSGAGASFAQGMAFQAPAGLAPSTCGMAASLCGIGRDSLGLDRLKLIYSVNSALDGVAMVYMGDEIALENNPRFAEDVGKAAELRWLHRPDMDWQRARAGESYHGLAGEMFAHLVRLGEVQKSLSGWCEGGPAMAGDAGDGRLLVLHRDLAEGRFTCIANVSADIVPMPEGLPCDDLLSHKQVTVLAPYQAIWNFRT